MGVLWGGAVSYERDTLVDAPPRLHLRPAPGRDPIMTASFSPSSLLYSLELSDTKIYEPQIRAFLGTASHFCKVVVPKLRTAS